MEEGSKCYSIKKVVEKIKPHYPNIVIIDIAMGIYRSLEPTDVGWMLLQGH